MGFQILKARRVELQCIATENAVRSGVRKKPRGNRPHNGDAVFEIPESLYVRSGQSGDIRQYRHSERPQSAARERVAEGNGCGGPPGSTRRRRKRTYMPAANL